MHRSISIRLLAVWFLTLAVPISLRGQKRAGLELPLTPAVSADHSLPPDRVRLPPRLVRPVPIFPGMVGLPQIIRAAGSIFLGRVTTVARGTVSGPDAMETVAITLHVDYAIRGSVTGQNFTITQWMGLWTGGQRYRVGERVLLFLYPASKLGLTSCVAGPLGRFGVDSLGRVVISDMHSAAFRDDPFLGGKSRVSFNDFAVAVQRAELN